MTAQDLEMEASETRNGPAAQSRLAAEPGRTWLIFLPRRLHRFTERLIPST